MKYEIIINGKNEELDNRTLEAELSNICYKYPRLDAEKTKYGVEISSVFPIPTEIREWLKKRGIYEEENDVVYPIHLIFVDVGTCNRCNKDHVRLYFYKEPYTLFYCKKCWEDLYVK